MTLVLGLLVSEAVVRARDGGALPHLDIFTTGADGRPELEANAETRLLRAGGLVSTVRTGPRGLRRGDASAPEPDWLVVGDSQVMGQGVEDRETFCAGAGLLNAGVPGYGLADALARAGQLASTSELHGVVVLVNQMNDWEEGLESAADRYVVRGGRLVRRANDRPVRAAFLDSALSQMHLLYFVAVLAWAEPDPVDPPQWLRDPAAQAPLTESMAGRIVAFSEAHPDLTVLPVFLPVDLATGEARAQHSPFQRRDLSGLQPWTDTTLRDQLAEALPAHLPLRDLLPVLRDQPDAFLDRDLHLSPEGHALVAAQLRTWIEQTQAPVGAP